MHFKRWIAFHDPIAKGLRLIPDGYVELVTPTGLTASFLEVDLGHESQTVWKEKVKNYLQFALSGDAEHKFGQSRFRVLVLANSERRLRSFAKPLPNPPRRFSGLPHYLPFAATDSLLPYGSVRRQTNHNHSLEKHHEVLLPMRTDDGRRTVVLQFLWSELRRKALPTSPPESTLSGSLLPVWKPGMLSTPQPKVSIWWNLAGWVLRAVATLLLIYVFLVALGALLQQPQIQNGLIGLAILAAILFGIWTEIPDWMRRLIRKAIRTKERRHGE